MWRTWYDGGDHDACGSVVWSCSVQCSEWRGAQCGARSGGGAHCGGGAQFGGDACCGCAQWCLVWW